MAVEPRDDVDQSESNAELSYENALRLIGEVEEVIDELEENGAGEEERAEELMERLVSSLEDLPVSSELARERIENVETWTDVLVAEEEPESGPGGIPTLLRDELAELRGFLEYEMTT